MRLAGDCGTVLEPVLPENGRVRCPEGAGEEGRAKCYRGLGVVMARGRGHLTDGTVSGGVADRSSTGGAMTGLLLATAGGFRRGLFVNKKQTAAWLISRVAARQKALHGRETMDERGRGG